MNPLLKALVWADRVINVLLGGNSRETLSARAHRSDAKDHPYWGWTASFIDTLFFWDDNHCREQWVHEQTNPFTDKLLPRDKLLHFCAGLGIALLAGWLLTPVFGLVVAAVAGALKEIQDRVDQFNGTPDVWDFVVTCCGGLAGTTFLLYL
jgi:hypothetical protein